MYCCIKHVNLCQSGISESQLADWSVFQTSSSVTSALWKQYITQLSVLIGWWWHHLCRTARRLCHDNQCALLLDFHLQPVWRPHKETHTCLSAQTVERGRFHRLSWNKRLLKMSPDTEEHYSETALTYSDSVSTSPEKLIGCIIWLYSFRD